MGVFDEGWIDGEGKKGNGVVLDVHMTLLLQKIRIASCRTSSISTRVLFALE